MDEQQFEQACLCWLADASFPLSTLDDLLNTFESATEIYETFLKNRDLFAPVQQRSAAGYRKFCSGANEERLLHFSNIMERFSIKAITKNHPLYPESLLQIEDAPPILFYRGNIQCLSDKSIAMIGSRKASYKGSEATEKIASELAKAGVTVISGLAEGIDSFAHKGALKAKGLTAAVMGCGLDRCYPSGNEHLMEEILQQNGVLLSEYAPETKPLGWHFPVRNRIISGLSKAVIMMECQIRSGSMTTVRHALNQGKDVYAYPGEPGTPWSEGSHQLLREGAIYFSTASDILEDYHWLDNPKKSVQNIVCSKNMPDLTPDQKKVFELLSRGSLSFEQLSNATELNITALSSALTSLQIFGLIRALPGKIYSII